MNSSDVKIEGVLNLNEFGLVSDKKEIDIGKIQAIIDKYKGKRDALIFIIYDIRALYQCLPQEALEYVAEKLAIPINKLYRKIDEKLAGAETETECLDLPGKPKLEYYPRCRDCGMQLADEPFTDIDTVVMTSYYCPKCKKEEFFYIDLEKIFRRKNMWCPTCCIYTREYTDDHECPNCGGEVFRTVSKSCKDRAIEYYPRCPDCNKVLSHDPLCDINTVSVLELFCDDCGKHQWLYIDLQKLYKNS